MTKRNRSTLKNYFRVGAMPTSEHFTDLIDSSLNLKEEGFDKTPEQGFKISALQGNASLMTFYRQAAPETPCWSVNFEQKNDALLFKNRAKIDSSNNAEQQDAAVLSLTQTGFVGINNNEPQRELDIHGVLKADGRIGSQLGKKQNIPADGKWHNISGKLEGCQAFEVMAGVGIKRSGRYALLHATALNTCNPSGFWFNFLNWKNPIKCQHAYYTSSANKLKLRWVAAPSDGDNNDAYRPYYLQIRSNSNYGDGILIRYHMTKLWFDHYMSESQLTSDEQQ